MAVVEVLGYMVACSQCSALGTQLEEEDIRNQSAGHAVTKLKQGSVTDGRGRPLGEDNLYAETTEQVEWDSWLRFQGKNVPEHSEGGDVERGKVRKTARATPDWALRTSGSWILLYVQ